jgi:hypothetical protein
MEPFTNQDIANRTAIASAPLRTRAELQDKIGPPKLSGKQRRVDVFELSGDQIVWGGVLPLLVRSRDRFESSTLVAYDTNDSVEAVDSQLLEQQVALQAGDYQFIVYSGLSVALARFREDLDTRMETGCTVLVSCDPNTIGQGSRPTKHDVNEGDPVCWRSIAIDHGAQESLIWPRLWTVKEQDASHRLSLAESPIAAKRTNVGQAPDCDHIFCYYDVFVPLRVPAGEHSIVFSAPAVLNNRILELEGDSLRSSLSCQDGELYYVNLRGAVTDNYSAGKRLIGFKWGRAAGSIEVTRAPPAALQGNTVLLYQYEWLLPEDRQTN